jgi:hypothetical protein
MSWNEQTTTFGMERSIDGFWHATRLFRVRGFKREGILYSPGSIMQYDNPTDIPPGAPNPSLPIIGTRGLNGADNGSIIDIGSEPGELVLHAYNAVVIPLDNPDYTDVEYRYTNDPRLVRKKVEDQLTFQSAEMELPIGVKSTVALLGNPAVPFAWTLVSRQFPFTVGRLSIVVLLNAEEVKAARLQVLIQTNALHAIPVSGVEEKLVMRFEGADIVRYSPTYYTCRYSWWYDDGHREIALSAAAGGDVALDLTLPPRNIPFFTDGSPPDGLNVAGLFIRPPYYRLDGVVRAGAGTAVAPSFYATRSSRYYGTGYLLLPGVVFP